MDDQRPQLSKNIERLRMNRGWSKTDLAKNAGISRPSISQYEAGERRPKIDAVRKIAEALRVSIADLDPYGIHEHPGKSPVVIHEEAAEYKSDDVFDRLASWMRLNATDDGKKAILMMAQAMGFRDRILTGVLAALCEPARKRAG